MNEQKPKSPQPVKKKGGVPWFVLIFLIPLLRNLGENGVSYGVIVVIVGAIIVAAALATYAKKGRDSKKTPDARSDRPQPTVQTSRPAPAMQRREPVTAQRQFTKPEAYCVSCDISGEDHFVRDRQRRIAQLDEWLKNGLIDREEYRTLKRRFENDQ